MARFRIEETNMGGTVHGYIYGVYVVRCPYEALECVGWAYRDMRLLKFCHEHPRNTELVKYYSMNGINLMVTKLES
jgi:hypothetical protein